MTNNNNKKKKKNQQQQQQQPAATRGRPRQQELEPPRRSKSKSSSSSSRSHDSGSEDSFAKLLANNKEKQNNRNKNNHGKGGGGGDDYDDDDDDYSSGSGGDDDYSSGSGGSSSNSSNRQSIESDDEEYVTATEDTTAAAAAAAKQRGGTSSSRSKKNNIDTNQKKKKIASSNIVKAKAPAPAKNKNVNSAQQQQKRGLRSRDQPQHQLSKPSATRSSKSRRRTYDNSSTPSAEAPASKNKPSTTTKGETSGGGRKPALNYKGEFNAEYTNIFNKSKADATTITDTYFDMVEERAPDDVDLNDLRNQMGFEFPDEEGFEDELTTSFRTWPRKHRGAPYIYKVYYAIVRGKLIVEKVKSSDWFDKKQYNVDFPSEIMEVVNEFFSGNCPSARRQDFRRHLDALTLDKENGELIRFSSQSIVLTAKETYRRLKKGFHQYPSPDSNTTQAKHYEKVREVAFKDFIDEDENPIKIYTEHVNIFNICSGNDLVYEKKTIQEQAQLKVGGEDVDDDDDQITLRENGSVPSDAMEDQLSGGGRGPDDGGGGDDDDKVDYEQDDSPPDIPERSNKKLQSKPSARKQEPSKPQKKKNQQPELGDEDPQLKDLVMKAGGMHGILTSKADLAESDVEYKEADDLKNLVDDIISLTEDKEMTLVTKNRRLGQSKKRLDNLLKRSISILGADEPGTVSFDEQGALVDAAGWIEEDLKYRGDRVLSAEASKVTKLIESFDSAFNEQDCQNSLQSTWKLAKSQAELKHRLWHSKSVLEAHEQETANDRVEGEENNDESISDTSLTSGADSGLPPPGDATKDPEASVTSETNNSGIEKDLPGSSLSGGAAKKKVVSANTSAVANAKMGKSSTTTGNLTRRTPTDNAKTGVATKPNEQSLSKEEGDTGTGKPAPESNIERPADDEEALDEKPDEEHPPPIMGISFSTRRKSSSSSSSMLTLSPTRAVDEKESSPQPTPPNTVWGRTFFDSHKKLLTNKEEILRSISTPVLQDYIVESAYAEEFLQIYNNILTNDDPSIPDPLLQDFKIDLAPENMGIDPGDLMKARDIGIHEMEYRSNSETLSEATESEVCDWLLKRISFELSYKDNDVVCDFFVAAEDKIERWITITAKKYSVSKEIVELCLDDITKEAMSVWNSNNEEAEAD